MLKGNSAEQYCLSIILSSAIAFVEVRNICTDVQDTRKCLGTRCNHSLQVFALFSDQFSSMLTAMCLLASFVYSKSNERFYHTAGDSCTNNLNIEFCQFLVAAAL